MCTDLVKFIALMINMGYKLGVWSLIQVWANPLYETDRNQPAFIILIANVCHTKKSEHFLVHVNRYTKNVAFDHSLDNEEQWTNASYENSNYSIMAAELFELYFYRKIYHNEDWAFWFDFKDPTTGNPLKIVCSNVWRCMFTLCPRVRELLRLMPLAIEGKLTEQMMIGLFDTSFEMEHLRVTIFAKSHALECINSGCLKALMEERKIYMDTLGILSEYSYAQVQNEVEADDK